MNKKGVNPSGSNTQTFYEEAGRGAGIFQDTKDPKDPQSLWSLVLKHGELIKFLHQAIEWENMLYLLYPYFWIHPQEWEDKLELDHPDPLHKAFLKAGSARVVLPIRPGFEKSFMNFIDRGTLEIPEDEKEKPPYVTIAEEMQNYAKTNYPGIRAANPVKNARLQLNYKQRKAWEEMQEIIKALETYKEKNSQYPGKLSDLNSTSIKEKDPWENEYYYKFPGDYADYDLASWGEKIPQDKNPEEAEIKSWAEASLIATWNEYTPSSALDIDLGNKKKT